MYSKLSYTSDDKITGTFPQAECSNLISAHSIKSDVFADPEILRLEFSLASKAKLTDVLSQAAISANGLLINEKVKNIIEHYNVMRHLLYPVFLKTKRNTEQYYWLHLVDNDMIKFIDFSNSKFYQTKFGFKEKEVSISSNEEYINIKTTLEWMDSIKADSITLNKEFDFSLDLFVMDDFDTRPYISETLWDHLQKEKVTGLFIEKALT
jgi:hypothetical protein